MVNYFGILFLLSVFLFSGLWMFSSKHKHLLVTLLSLEYIMLNVFFLLVLASGQDLSEVYSSLVFLVFAVSEGALGLSILVSIVRSHGSDYMGSFSLVW